MSDRLGEALARFAQFVADHPGVLPTKDIADIVAAARSWHALATDPDVRNALLLTEHNTDHQIRVLRSSLLDTLTVTADETP